MYTHELAFAHGLADRAADIGLGLFRREGLVIAEKADRTLVTQADTAIERMVREQIAAAFPDDHVLGEEEGGEHGRDGRVWIVDPVDATANFARGVPIWATLIALHIDGEGVLGVAAAPALGERYAAVRGEGATMNGVPIRVSEIAQVAEAHVLHGGLNHLLDGRWREATLGLILDPWRSRGLGDFWSHMLVARGAAEVMVEPELAIWDWAALQVIVEEAGGRITTFDGEPLRHKGSVLSTNGLLHDEVLRRFAGEPGRGHV